MRVRRRKGVRSLGGGAINHKHSGKQQQSPASMAASSSKSRSLPEGPPHAQDPSSTPGLIPLPLTHSPEGPLPPGPPLPPPAPGHRDFSSPGATFTLAPVLGHCHSTTTHWPFKHMRAPPHHHHLPRHAAPPSSCKNHSKECHNCTTRG